MQQCGFNRTEVGGAGNLNSASGIYGFTSVDQHAEKTGAIACARLIEGIAGKTAQ